MKYISGIRIAAEEKNLIDKMQNLQYIRRKYCYELIAYSSRNSFAKLPISEILISGDIHKRAIFLILEVEEGDFLRNKDFNIIDGISSSGDYDIHI